MLDTAVRHFCCRKKLAQPAQSRRKAFCARGTRIRSIAAGASSTSGRSSGDRPTGSSAKGRIARPHFGAACLHVRRGAKAPKYGERSATRQKPGERPRGTRGAAQANLRTRRAAAQPLRRASIRRRTSRRQRHLAEPRHATGSTSRPRSSGGLRHDRTSLSWLWPAPRRRR